VVPTPPSPVLVLNIIAKATKESRGVRRQTTFLKATSHPSPLRLIVAEDTYLIREGIRQMLAEDAGVEVVAFCSDLGSLLRSVEDLRPELVITDIRMPPTHTDEGIRAATELRRTQPETAVVVMSQYLDAQYAIDLFEEGSSGRGYLLKERLSDRNRVLDAIREVAAGGSVVDPAVVEALVGSVSGLQQKDSRLATLSQREMEVLALVAEGKSNAAIADVLFITKRAVEKHVNVIFQKLDLGDRADVSLRVAATLVFLADPERADDTPAE
jgi:DNA-binding NarL/FixJ family response regulator